MQISRLSFCTQIDKNDLGLHNNRMGKSKSAGFTLVEVVIVLAVIAILSAVLMPMIAKNIESARMARASADTATIAKAIVAFFQDLGQWPVYRGGTAHYLLFSAQDADNNGVPDLGSIPPGWNTAGRPLSLHFELIANGNARTPGPSPDGLPVWNGPYLTQMDVDPWGTPYLVNARWLTDTATANGGVYVISAGPQYGGNPVQVEMAFDGLPDPSSGNDISFRIK